jgi:hypothetical protein
MSVAREGLYSYQLARTVCFRLVNAIGVRLLPFDDVHRADESTGGPGHQENIQASFFNVYFPPDTYGHKYLARKGLRCENICT